MKNIILISILIGLIFSCSKDDESQISQGIVGRWIWVESSGGIGGITETPETTGNIVVIEFTDKKYTKYINGDVDDEMTYTLETGSSIRTLENTEIIIYENDWKQSFELNENKLILYDECYDCFQNEYIKE